MGRSSSIYAHVRHSGCSSQARVFPDAAHVVARRAYVLRRQARLEESLRRSSMRCLPSQAGLNAPGTVWRAIENVSSRTICFVLASVHMGGDDYSSDYEEFRPSPWDPGGRRPRPETGAEALVASRVFHITFRLGGEAADVGSRANETMPSRSAPSAKTFARRRSSRSVDATRPDGAPRTRGVARPYGV